MNRRRWKMRYEKAIVFTGYHGTGSIGSATTRLVDTGDRGLGVIGGDRLSNAAYTPYGPYGSASRESRNVLGR
jgi:hypothetical protein